jgi:hypothetical protein
VAWTILPAGKNQAWRREWLRMRRVLRPAIPDDWTVIVLTDRGRYARWLFRRIVRLGWHPFMRITRGAQFSPAGTGQWYWLDEVLQRGGTRWQGRGIAFKSKESHLSCTLLAWWDDAQAEPWFVLTDLDPDACAIEWYALRAWCEQGFNCTKRGGWQWQQTQMTAPRRAERLWLALAVAMLWMVSLGTEGEVGAPEDVADLPDLQRLLGGAGRKRCLRRFRLGWLWLRARALRAQPVLVPRHLVPEPWPGCWGAGGAGRAPPPG